MIQSRSMDINALKKHQTDVKAIWPSVGAKVGASWRRILTNGVILERPGAQPSFQAPESPIVWNLFGSGLSRLSTDWS